MTLTERLLVSFAAIPATEWLAVALALGYLFLAVRQNAWCWVCAAASSAIYLLLFARAGLFMQSALQVFYIAMAVYGWYAWRGGRDAQVAPLEVSPWTPTTHSLAIGSALLATGVNGWLLAPPAGGAVPYVDALVAWVSVLATWMVARKVLENWLYWIVIDLVAAGLYWTQGFHATTALYLVYIVVAARGFLVAVESSLSTEPNAAGVGRIGAATQCFSFS